MYYQDRLGGQGFSRVLAGGAAPSALTSAALGRDSGAPWCARRTGGARRRRADRGGASPTPSRPPSGWPLRCGPRRRAMPPPDRINLSTRPFYNERVVHLSLALAAVLVVAVTAFNLWQVFGLSGRQAELQGRISRAEATSRDFRDRAAAIRRSINPRELEATVAAAREANLLIERRVFSWTDVLNQFETTLPASVRISSVRPRIERDGTMVVAVVVLARTVEARRRLHREPREARRVQRRALEGRVRQRGRAHPGQPPGPVPACRRHPRPPRRRPCDERQPAARVPRTPGDHPADRRRAARECRHLRPGGVPVVGQGGARRAAGTGGAPGTGGGPA